MTVSTNSNRTTTSPRVGWLGISLHTLLLTCLIFCPVTIQRSNLKARPAVKFKSQENVYLSTPLECARQCVAGEAPRTCYYKFILENYATCGGACQYCTPDFNNTLSNDCQCVLADGVERGVLTVNRRIPGPSIQVCEGDKVVIDVVNRLEGMDTAIHWHGILQKGTPYHDGVPMLTQCPILQGTTFRYQWTANAGTHFWHSHAGLQKLDGLYGSIIVREPRSSDPNSNRHDFDSPDHVILISDWMHHQATNRFPGLLVDHGQTPKSLLINGRGSYTDPKTNTTNNGTLQVFTIRRGHRYRFRLINTFCTVCPAELTIQNHRMTLIAADGEPIRPVKIDTIISLAGERYDFVITANQRSGTYWIQLRALGECRFESIQQLAILRYEGGRTSYSAKRPSYDLHLDRGVVLNPLDGICNKSRTDAVCISQLKNGRDVDAELLRDSPDVKIYLPFRFYAYSLGEAFKPDTYNRFLVTPGGVPRMSLISNISFMYPPSPPLSQIHDIPPNTFCNRDHLPPNCGDSCMCTHKIDIPLHSVVEVVLVDEVAQPNLTHPFHLHGHSFKVIGMGRDPENKSKKINVKRVRYLDRIGRLHRRFNLPPSKDTLAVPDNGWVIFRFRADNPGYWLMHCHFLYHVAIGMDIVLQVGNTTDLPPVPPNFPVCRDYLPPITRISSK